MVKETIIKTLFLLTAIFVLLSGHCLYSQSTDTIKIEIAQTVYDTTRVYDTVYIYDTVYVDRFITGFDASVSYSQFLTSFRSYSPSNQKVISQNNFSVGMEFGIIANKWKFSPGFSFTSFLQQVQYDFTTSRIETHKEIELIPMQEEIIDTIVTEWQYFTWDSITQGDTLQILDSVLIYVLTDTTFINYNDTIVKTIFDTITTDTSVLKKENLRYFEVPLIIRYSFYEKEKLNLNIGAGFIAGLLLISETYYIDTGTESIQMYNQNNYYKFLPSLWLSLGINYCLHERLCVSIEPYYCLGLQSVFVAEIPEIKIPDRYGLKFGINYIF